MCLPDMVVWVSPSLDDWSESCVVSLVTSVSCWSSTSLVTSMSCWNSTSAISGSRSVGQSTDTQHLGKVLFSYYLFQYKTIIFPTGNSITHVYQANITSFFLISHFPQLKLLFYDLQFIFTIYLYNSKTQ